MLLGQMMARIQFKNENMIHTRFTPSLQNNRNLKKKVAFFLKTRNSEFTWTLSPIKNRNRAISMGPRYKRTMILQLFSWLLWKIAKWRMNAKVRQHKTQLIRNIPLTWNNHCNKQADERTGKKSNFQSCEIWLSFTQWWDSKTFHCFLAIATLFVILQYE